ncbi:MAG TPA: hypothetical protein VGS57_04120 [Thermoanaerobaculia bacterium]|nr:hypothetical protein [Thermoanaerobaculia bacterium]
MPRQGHLVAAGPSRLAGSPSRRSARRTLLLAAWAVLLAALFAVALRSSTDDAVARTDATHVAGRSAAGR